MKKPLPIASPRNSAHTHTHPHVHCTHGTCGVLHCLLFCDQTRPNLRISLVGYHCAIEFPCGVPLFYCCKYPTTYGVRVHTVHMALVRYFIVFSFVTKPGQTLEFLLWGTIVPLNFLVGYHCSIVASTPQPMVYASTQVYNNVLCTVCMDPHNVMSVGVCWSLDGHS